MASAQQEVGALMVAPPAVGDALGAIERKGLRLIGAKLVRHGVDSDVQHCVLAFRGVGAVALAVRTGVSLGERCDRASGSLAEALEMVLEHFKARELLEDDKLLLPQPLAAPAQHAQTGTTLDLSELLAAEPGSEIGARFCRALRVEGYVHVVLPAETARVLRRLEELSGAWYALEPDLKEDDCSEYGHVDRKFTGYRQGRYREQLEVRLQTAGGVLPAPAKVEGFARGLEDALSVLDAHGRSLMRHIAHEVGVDVDWFHNLLDPPRDAPMAASTAARANGAAGPPSLHHSLVRVCRYVAGVEGVGGSNILCDDHTDVGFITIDAHARRPGLQVRRRADGAWLDVEAELRADEQSCVVAAVMVGDTLARTTAGYFAATPHRVCAPPSGERIGLPFLFRGRSDAVIDTSAAIAAAKAAGRAVHLSSMQSTTIKELPALDAAHSILHNWFHASKAEKGGSAPQH